MPTENINVTGTLADGAVTTAKLADDAVTFAKMQNIPNGHLLGRHTSGSGDVQSINIDGGLELNGANIRRAALTGDVTATAGSNSTAIANDAVTNAKLANMAEATIKGRQAGSGTGDPEDLTATQARTALGLGTAALNNTGDFDAAGSAAAAQAAAISTASTDATTKANAAQAAAIAASAQRASNLSDLANAATARTNLGLGTAATVNTGTGSGNVPTIAQADARYAPLSAPTFISFTGLSLATTITSLADVDAAIEHAIPAAGFYEFEFFITYASASTATGAWFSLNGSGTFSYLTCDIGVSTTVADRSSFQISTFNAGFAAPSSQSTSTGGNNALMSGKINATSSGNIRLRFATETGGSAITVNSVTGFIRRLY